MRRDGTAPLALVAACALALGGCASSRKAETPFESRDRVVRPAVAYEMLRDSPELVVLDVRPFTDYEARAGHLERAVSAPLDDLLELSASLELRREDTILVYGGSDPLVQTEASRLLIEQGLRFVVEIEGGLDAWVEDGFPVVVEDAPLSPLRPLSAGRD
jgi:rhodanese-related sulfurtransferase